LIEEVKAGEVRVGSKEDSVEGGSLMGQSEVSFAVEELLLPVRGVRRGGGHGEEEVVAVFEEDFWQAARGSERGEIAKGVDFAEDAGAVTEPVLLHAKLGQGLLENEVRLAGDAGAEDKIGNAAGEFGDCQAGRVEVEALGEVMRR